MPWVNLKKSQRYVNRYKKCFTFFFSHSIRMSGKSENFGHKKTNKSNFYKNEGLFKINDFDLIIY